MYCFFFFCSKCYPCAKVNNNNNNMLYFYRSFVSKKKMSVTHSTLKAVQLTIVETWYNYYKVKQLNDFVTMIHEKHTTFSRKDIWQLVYQTMKHRHLEPFVYVLF